MKKEGPHKTPVVCGADSFFLVFNVISDMTLLWTVEIVTYINKIPHPGWGR
jgi:hypothetical protein